MRTRLALVGFFFLFLTVLPWTDPTAQSSYWVVRAYYDDPQMIAEVAGWLGPWEVHSKEGYLVAGVDKIGYARLEALGFRVEVDEKLTAAINQPQRRLPGQANGIPGYPCYRTVDETFAAAQALAQRYPNLVTWSDIGDSWEKTASIGEPGDDLWVLRLTNQAVTEPKPKLFVMAALLALISVILPSGAPPDMARRMAIGHGLYAALFTATGLLFRRASLAELK